MPLQTSTPVAFPTGPFPLNPSPMMVPGYFPPGYNPYPIPGSVSPGHATSEDASISGSDFDPRAGINRQLHSNTSNNLVNPYSIYALLHIGSTSHVPLSSASPLDGSFPPP
eukprot:1018983-Ditylum_brightwellii.AAC.1